MPITVSNEVGGHNMVIQASQLLIL